MMLKCGHCDKMFKYESERKRHQESHFPQFGCTVCAKKFSFLSALRRHQKQHERKGSVRCNKCGGNFRDDTLLKRHMQYAHTGSYSCIECSATFSSEQALLTHTTIHKPESERRFRCTFTGCKKTFNFPHHLKHHELTHTNAKQHFCNVCQKGFIQSHHLKSHLKTHLPENWLHCTVSGCKKKFITKHAWKRHTTTHNKCTDVNHTEIRTDSGISSDSNPSNDIHEKDDSGQDDQCVTCGKLIKRFEYLNHTLNCRAMPKELSLCDDSHDTLLNHDGNYQLQDENESCSNGAHRVASGTRAGGARVESNNEYKSDCTHNCDISEHNNTGTSVTNGSPGAHCDAAGAACAGCAGDGRGRRSPLPRGPDKNSCFKSNQSSTRVNNNMPELEYRKDGIIKIRETFDADIIIVKNVSPESNKKVVVSKSKDKIETNELKYVPFNSCKAVLGNCIVSEDGSVGEGCLCAKMIVDEQQMSAQEIEELTPNPNSFWLSMNY